jgi:hypothetical protein
MYLDAIAKKGSGGGSALPAVTSDDNGKMLTVVDGAWAAADNRFVVTCTPTAQDYSGTMDKTPSEIDEAWNSGKSIWFKVGSSTSPIAERTEGPDGNSYSAYIINGIMNTLILATTAATTNTYITTIYQLTPLGS